MCVDGSLAAVLGGVGVDGAGEKKKKMFGKGLAGGFFLATLPASCEVEILWRVRLHDNDARMI